MSKKDWRVPCEKCGTKKHRGLTQDQKTLKWLCDNCMEFRMVRYVPAKGKVK